jgi:hypothetical protein
LSREGAANIVTSLLTQLTVLAPVWYCHAANYLSWLILNN